MIDVIIVGAGGFAIELAQYASELGNQYRIKGFLDDDLVKLNRVRNLLEPEVAMDTHSYPVQGNDGFVVTWGKAKTRRILADRLAQRGARFLTLVHPTADVARTARLGVGCVVGPFATVESHSTLGDHVLVNIRATVGPNATVGSYSLLSPQSMVNYGTILGTEVLLGTNALIMNDLRVGDRSNVAPGAVVYHDVPEGFLAIGNPAETYLVP